ncbi:hypothetical protein F2Q68_00041124 [Brassica cretica]|uniref:Uncharacterized protein n=1 Tax=Brassica cretica TaxID=69181 RepID=A0A8S9MPA4_BRACR|nr:hypothetical protein F2Q68_00041124 [Brassica cretica]
MLRYHQGHLQFKTFGYNQGRVGTTEVQQQSGPAIDPQSGHSMEIILLCTKEVMTRQNVAPVLSHSIYTPFLNSFTFIVFLSEELDCPLVVTACANYLEAVPWEDGEEDEMLLVIPMIGSEADPVLARLQPVDQSAVTGIFSSAFRFATSSPPLSLCDIKASAQEQI